jgi:hypothetical protein
MSLIKGVWGGMCEHPEFAHFSADLINAQFSSCKQKAFPSYLGESWRERNSENSRLIE